MKIIRPIPFLVVAALFIPLAAHAQNGCVNSPEAPTAVLMLVGSAGTLFSFGMSRRIQRSRSRKQPRG